jgi:hypothetical protein
VAIYRPSRSRWPLAVAAAVVGAAIGLVVGLLLAGGEPDPGAVVSDVRADVRAARGLLDVVKVEYQEAVSDGEVTTVQEYGGARDALGRSRARFDKAARVLEPLDRRATEKIVDAYARVAQMMGETAPAHDVLDQIDHLDSLLEGITGGP